MLANALSFLAGDCLMQALPEVPAPAWGSVLIVVLALAVARRWHLVISAVAGFAWAWSSAVAGLAHDVLVSIGVVAWLSR